MPSGVTLVADLYVGTSSSSLAFVSSTTFSAAAGRYNTVNTVLSNIPGGVPQYFQVQVRDNNFSNADIAAAAHSYYGKSIIFTTIPGSNIVFNSIVNMNTPAQSTWAVGSFDMSVQTGISGALGAIAVGVDASGGPIILSQPASQAVPIGSSASFFVSVMNEFPLPPPRFQYQWQVAGVDIPGANHFNLAVPNVQIQDSGRYRGVVSNSLGIAVSSYATLQVIPPNAPSILVNSNLAVGSVPFASTALISISGGFPNGFIFYTLDGTAPDTSSPLYSGPFSLTSNAVIQAMSLSADFSQSSVAPPVNVLMAPAYPLSTSVTGGGIVRVFPLAANYLSNSVVTLTALPAKGWTFDHWSGDLSGNANPADLTMNGQRNVTAVFAQTTVPLTVSTPGGGVVMANGQVLSSQTYYPTGSVVSLTATPHGGWSFLGWQGTTSSAAQSVSAFDDASTDRSGDFRHGCYHQYRRKWDGRIKPNEPHAIRHSSHGHGHSCT